MPDKISLRDYVEHHWDNHQREHDSAQVVLDGRLHVLNELRSGVLTRDEYNARHDALVLQLNALQERVTKMEGRGSGISSSWGVIVAVVTILIAIAGVVVVVVVHG